MGNVYVPHPLGQIPKFGVLGCTEPIGAMSMASRVGNQPYHLCKMSEVVTGNFLEAHFRARLATGWQTASRLPAGYQNNTEKVAHNNTRTLKNLSGMLRECICSFYDVIWTVWAISGFGPRTLSDGLWGGTLSLKARFWRFYFSFFLDRWKSLSQSTKSSHKNQLSRGRTDGLTSLI